MQALKNNPITIYGDGSQTRSFCYVDDLINGMIKLMSADDKLTGPINLGNPVEIPVRHLAKIIIDLTKSSSEIIEKELPGDDPKKRQPDISLAKKKLNWQPKIKLEDGINKTIKYFQTLIAEA